MDDVKATLNQGKKVTLQHGREVVFKDPEFFAILAVSGRIVELLQSPQARGLLSDKEAAGSGLATLLNTDIGKEAICALFGASCGEDPELFRTMTLTDTLRCLAAMKEAVNFEELKELFFEVVPKEAFQNLQEK